MKIKRYIKFLESIDSIEILKELTLELQDNGLKVNIRNDPKFDNKPTIAISDDDKIYCKNYPENDMDWLYDKPIMFEFYKDLDAFGLIRDKDYKIYGGGLGVNIVFTEKSLKRVKL